MFHTGSVCRVSIPSWRPAISRRLRSADPTATPPCPRHAGDQGVHPADLLVGQPAGAAGQEPAPNHPAPNGLRKGRQADGVETVRGHRLGERAGRQLVECLGVLPQRRRGAGKGLGDAAAEHLLQQRQHLGAQPGPGESAIAVVRVLPRCQSQFGARRMRHRTTDAQQRAVPRRVVRAHAGDGACARAAAQPQQHRLGLIVQRVRKQHRRVASRGVQRLVPRGAGRGLGTARGAHVDAKHLSLNASQRDRLVARRRRHLVGVGLQTDGRRSAP